MMKSILTLTFIASTCHSFQGLTSFPPNSRLILPTRQGNSHLFSSGKGFGTASSSSGSGGKGFGDSVDEIKDVEQVQQSAISPEDIKRVPSPALTSKLSAEDTERIKGKALAKKALDRMRRDKVEKKDAELRKIKEMRSIDESLKENPGAAAIPEKVAKRMGNRMLPFVGIPLFGGMGSFVVFWYLATYKGMEFQPAIVGITTIVFLAIGLVGITYSVMSSSWDEDREGSFLGFEEFSKNVDNIKGGVSRSSENALLRERMAGMPEEEIERAIRDLDRRDAERAAGKR